MYHQNIKLTLSQIRQNTAFLVACSFIPFLSIYPLIKLHKVRSMLVIYGFVLGSAFLASYIMLEIGFTYQTGLLLPMFSAFLFSLIGQGFCVYGWSKTYNQSLNT